MKTKHKPTDPRLSEGFRAAIVLIERTGCWHWTKGRDGRTGEPSCHQGGKRIKAAVVAYEALVGPVPENHALERRCGDSTCVNPQHRRPVDRRRRDTKEQECPSSPESRSPTPASAST